MSHLGFSALDIGQALDMVMQKVQKCNIHGHILAVHWRLLRLAQAKSPSRYGVRPSRLRAPLLFAARQAAGGIRLRAPLLFAARQAAGGNLSI
jgi:hypothetical protein